MKKFHVYALTSILVVIASIILLLCIFALPQVAQETARLNPEVAYLQYPILLGMYATAVPCLYAIYETIKIIHMMERQEIFTNRIAQALNRIKYCAFTIITLYVAGIIILDAANAMPPLVALMGMTILIVTVLVASAASFLRNVVVKNNMQLSN